MKQTIKFSLISMLLLAAVLSNKNIAAAAAPAQKLGEKSSGLRSMAELCREIERIKQEKSNVHKELKDTEALLELVEKQDRDIVIGTIASFGSQIMALDASEAHVQKQLDEQKKLSFGLYALRQSAFQLHPLEKVSLQGYGMLMEQYRGLQRQRSAIVASRSTEVQIIDLTIAIDLKLEELKKLLREASKNPYYYSGDLGDKYLEIEDRGYQHHVQYGNVFAVPGSVDGQLIHLVGTKQNESICGFLTFAHAWAIDWLIANGQPVTSDSIQVMSQKIFNDEVMSTEIFKKYKTLGSNTVKYLTCEDAEKIAYKPHYESRLGMQYDESLYSESIMPGFDIAPGFYKLSVGTMNLIALLKNSLRIKRLIESDIKTRPATHFIINSGKHWSLVSVINNGTTRTRQAIHINSSNNPLGEDNPEMLAIREIINVVCAL